MTGRIDVVAAVLAEAVTSVSNELEHVDIAVAYASVGGVRVLLSQVSSAPSWERSTKRFLVSMDSGFTEPDALLALSRLPNSEVRIPNATDVLKSTALRPARPFHPKAYLFRGATSSMLSALVVGSANLTASAMSTGAEVVTAQFGRRNADVGTFLDWFEDAWDRAVPLSLVLDEYRRKRPLRGGRPPSAEDQDRAATVYTPPPGVAVAVRGPDAARLSTAKAYWIEAGRLSRNRGPTLPGNQLDTPRGARVFFGFTPVDVPRNHIFGEIELRYDTGVYDRYSVRFGNNQMDKVNLPVPGAAGPTTYDGEILLFVRDPPVTRGPERFTVSLISRTALLRRQRSATTSWEGQMNSGRSWGLLF